MLYSQTSKLTDNKRKGRRKMCKKIENVLISLKMLKSKIVCYTLMQGSHTPTETAT